MNATKNHRMTRLKKVSPPADDALVSDAIIQQVVEARICGAEAMK